MARIPGVPAARGTEQDGLGDLVAKDRKEITSSSLQNLLDSDASYRYKAGR